MNEQLANKERKAKVQRSQFIMKYYMYCLLVTIEGILTIICIMCTNDTIHIYCVPMVPGTYRPYVDS